VFPHFCVIYWIVLIRLISVSLIVGNWCVVLLVLIGGWFVYNCFVLRLWEAVSDEA